MSKNFDPWGNMADIASKKIQEEFEVKNPELSDVVDTLSENEGVTSEELDQTKKPQDIEKETKAVKAYISDNVGIDIQVKLCVAMDGLDQDYSKSLSVLDTILEKVETKKAKDIKSLIIDHYVKKNEDGMREYIKNSNVSQRAKTFFQGSVDMLEKGKCIKDVKNYLNLGVRDSENKKEAKEIKERIIQFYKPTTEVDLGYSSTVWGTVKKIFVDLSNKYQKARELVK